MPDEFIRKYAHDSNGRLEYEGEAEPGTLVTEGKWRIQKYTYSGIEETDKQYPNGDNANVYIWNSRETYTYS